MKRQLLETYAPPVAESVTLYTEQCMTGGSGEGTINNLNPLVPILDEGV